jgi:hypothetical protein
LGLAGSLLESNVIGKTISMSIEAGTVGFSFSDNANGGHSFVNGKHQAPSFGFAILKGQKNKYGSFQYLLGFNDSYGGDADYDDFVVGVNFVSSPVPEPETYMMMFAGIVLIGFSARRRNNNNWNDLDS